MDPRVILCRFGLHPSITISGEPLPFSILFVSSLFIEHTYVRACCCLPGSTYRKHITAQPIKRAQSSRASTCSRSARDNVCQQTKEKSREQASRRATSIQQLAVSKRTNEEDTSKSARRSLKKTKKKRTRWSSWHLQVASLHLQSSASLSASLPCCCLPFVSEMLPTSHRIRRHIRPEIHTSR